MSARAAVAWAASTLVLGCGLSSFPVPDASAPVADPRPGSPANPGPSPPSPAPAPPVAGGTSGSGGGGGGQLTGDAAAPPPVGGSGGPDGAGMGGGGRGVGTADAAGVAADAGLPPPPPPGSGAAISINGTLVPREKVLVFLHIGHSNMAGRVTTPASLRPFNFETHPQLWAYGRGGVWRPAKEPLSPDSMADDCGGVGCAGLPFGAGPGMSILRRALALQPDSYVVSIGKGQSGLTSGYCRSFRKGGLLYNFVMGPAMELKGKVTFGAIWTMFGQSEANDAANNSRFGDCMVAVASDMRTNLGEPDLPFLVGDWEEEAGGSLSTSSGTARVIIPQMRALPMRIPRSAVIPTDGLPINPLDDQHFDLTGHKLWAERGFDLLQKNGWAPWAMP